MTQADRSRLAVALVLIVLGAWFLVVQFYPPLQSWANARTTWPLAVIAVGALLLVIAVAIGVPGLLVPASIVGGVGGLLYWQNATGNFESWAYAWTLIIGFVGLGVLLSELIQGNGRRALTAGGWTIITSLVLFLIFASFLGGPNLLGAYWPVLLILLGVMSLVRTFVRARSF